MLSDLRLYFCNFIISYIPFHFIRLCYYKLIMGFEIGRGSSIHLGCQFNAKGNFYLGSNSTINQFCRIDNRGKIIIGTNVSISPYVKLLSADHDLNDREAKGRSKEIIIEDYVFIGSDAMVLGGIKMQKGSVLGAKSLLTKSILPYEIHFGVPAKLKGLRSSDLNYDASYKRWFH